MLPAVLMSTIWLRAISYAARRTYVINYECRRRAAPILQRTVAVRYPHRLPVGQVGNSKKSGCTGSCGQATETMGVNV